MSKPVHEQTQFAGAHRSALNHLIPEDREGAATALVRVAIGAEETTGMSWLGPLPAIPMRSHKPTSMTVRAGFRKDGCTKVKEPAAIGLDGRISLTHKPRLVDAATEPKEIENAELTLMNAPHPTITIRPFSAQMYDHRVENNTPYVAI